MSATISTENERFLATAVAEGAFPTREDAVDQALSLLRQRHEALERIKARAVVFPNLPAELEQLAGKAIRFRGTRIGLDLVLSRHFAGDTPDQIHSQFPTVPLEALRRTVEYVRAHEPLLKAYLQQQQLLASLLCDNAHRGPSLEELKTRLEDQVGRSST